jgi:hypothetical protein
MAVIFPCRVEYASFASVTGEGVPALVLEKSVHVDERDFLNRIR